MLGRAKVSVSESTDVETFFDDDFEIALKAFLERVNGQGSSAMMANGRMLVIKGITAAVVPSDQLRQIVVKHPNVKLALVRRQREAIDSDEVVKLSVEQLRKIAQIIGVN